MAGTLIHESSTVRAWAAAASRLNEPGQLPAFMAVSAGGALASSGQVIQRIDACAHAAGAERPGTVAEVLFPHRVSAAVGTAIERMDAGWRLWGRGRRRGLRFSGWRHTYFERLTGRSMGRDLILREIKENRLLSIIAKMKSWDRDIEGAFYAHTDAPSDTLRPRGSPCLQYVQFRPFGGNQLELFALYRSHDYFNKSLGNMIGLQRLGEFVADETGRTFVSTTVFSLHPTVGPSKQALRGLVENITAIPGV